MSDIGDSLIRSLEEALAHAKGQGPALVHGVVDPLAIRGEAGFSQAQMATLLGFSDEDYEE